MSEPTADTFSTDAPAGPWHILVQQAACPECHWDFLIPSGAKPTRCPNCFRGELRTFPETVKDASQGIGAAAETSYSPELVIPYQLTGQQIEQALTNFTDGIPFAPAGLNPAALRGQLVRVYFPMWLVDGTVSACWQAEAGFDYQVVSHQEHYNGENRQWQSREIEEPRVRWENRVGQLNRAYQNLPVPALAESARLDKCLGSFQLDTARSYDAAFLQDACVRLPDQTPGKAWSEASAAFQKTAAEECQRACSAGHLRQFRWTAKFDRLNWTLMLMPLYATCYQDDDGRHQPLLIHGQTGKVSGVRKSSLRRAARASLSIVIISFLIFLTGLLLDSTAAYHSLSAVTTYTIMIGIAGMLAAALPVLIAWDFNRKQTLEEAKAR